MIINENLTKSHCLIQCDDCKKQWKGVKTTFLTRNIHLCGSCRQKGNKNPMHGIKADPKNNPTCKAYWIDKGYTEEEASYQIKKKNKKYKEYWIAKGYTEEEAKNKAYEINWQYSPFNKQKWISKGYSEEEALKKVNEHNKRVSKTNKQNFKRENNWTCKAYWIAKGYTEEEAFENISKRQRKIHEHIDYKELGKKSAHTIKTKWTEEQRKEKAEKHRKHAKKNLNKTPIMKEYWLAKGHSLKEANYRAAVAKGENSGVNGSKIENDFFECFQHTFVRNKFITCNKKRYIPDGKINNLIFEFNGTNPHLDDRFHTNESINPWGKSYEEVKQYDKEKIENYLSKGYYVFIVWEYDWLNNQEQIEKELNLKIKLLKENKKYETSKENRFWDSSSL